MTQASNVSVSYVNIVDRSDRYIYFHLPWIAQLVSIIAEEIDQIADTLPKPEPSKWWIEV